MTPAELHDRLAELLATLVRLTASHRTICGAAAADKVALGALRWQIARAGRERMELLADVILPLLERRCAGPDLAAVRAFRDAGIAYRRGVSDYLARWPNAAILADWTSYGREAEAFRATITAQIALERRLLLPILRALPAEARELAEA